LKAFRGTVLGLVLLLSACEIEPTPADYIDRATSAEAGRAQAEAEVRDRVLAMGQALARRNPTDAFLALAPARELFVVGPGAETGDGPGPERIRAILESLAAQPTPVQARDVVVNVAPRANVAWFRAVLDGEGEDIPGLRVTGVYELNEGAWQLVQAHLSNPLMPPSPSSPPEPGADSAAVE
jgi:SnoaL-like domain